MLKRGFCIRNVMCDPTAKTSTSHHKALVSFPHFPLRSLSSVQASASIRKVDDVNITKSGRPKRVEEDVGKVQ